jgi:hypothetical protein
MELGRNIIIPMDRHILHRLLLAKLFMQDAERTARTSGNDLGLSRVVVQLHDAIDNLLGAVATERDIRLAGRDAMMDVFSKLTSAGHLGGGRAELEQLNTMRNAIKHQGVPQNTAAVIALLPLVHAFGNDVAIATFGVSLDALSLTELIQDEPTRNDLDEIYSLITKSEFKAALERLGLVRFQRIQSHSLGMVAMLRKLMEKLALRDQVLVFPKQDPAEARLECLELGIDPDELTRFEWLTPQYGFADMETKGIIVKKEGLFWHARNWTYENALFCFNFIVNYIAARQKTPYTSTVHRLDFKLNDLTFVKPSTLTTYGREILREFSEGETVSCWATELVDGEWQNHGEARAKVRVYSSDGFTMDGYVLKADVTVGPDRDEVFGQPVAG